MMTDEAANRGWRQKSNLFPFENSVDSKESTQHELPCPVLLSNLSG